MTRNAGFSPFVLIFASILSSQCVLAKEYQFLADIDARALYDDNIFLTTQKHDAVTGVVITPAVTGVVKEKNWKLDLGASLKSNNYSDRSLNSNDKYFDLTGAYNLERNIFSLNYNYDLDSNLSSTSTDFGIAGRRVQRKMQSITPQYTRLMTERLVFMLSYTYSDVDYFDASNTGYLPYLLQSGNGSFVYSLTEKDSLSLSLQAVDYRSKDDLVTYQMFVSRLGIDHKISETLSIDFLAGVSRQNSTNKNTTSFDFFGNVIVLTQEVDYKNRNFVMDAGITKSFERSDLKARLSQTNTTNSFGGLNKVDTFKLTYNYRLSELWRYMVNGRYEDVNAISAGNRNTDRQVLLAEFTTYYSLARDWNIKASYRYISRKFKNTGADTQAPHSNRIYLGLTYNFPSLSTF